MKKYFFGYLIFFISINLFAQKSAVVSVLKNDAGMKLMVNEKPFMINGMNWGYFPIGKNYEFSLWNQPEEFIKKALDDEMRLLKNIGVNTIRVYTRIQPKWISYIYNKYGIFTMLNHSFGRYGVALNGVWTPITDYRNPETKKVLLSEVTELAETYKNTPGLLLFLLGNENNYGLFWAGAETEDFPDDENLKRKLGEERGRPMYKLFNEAALLMKKIDQNHPIAICNGDLLFLDIIADECKDVDILGTNMYRGKSFGAAFESVKKQLNKPILFTEFGADAFNALSNKEDQEMQAFYAVENWKEIYENAAGLGKANNSIGGFTFQFSDGWWKLGQTKDLDVHNTGASWGNGGYDLDFKKGIHNMNEEWFGICAKGPTNSEGFYKLYPRAAYYALKKVHEFNPYKKSATEKLIEKHFCSIKINKTVKKAKKNKELLEKIDKN
jgi:hypothetical protein